MSLGRVLLSHADSVSAKGHARAFHQPAGRLVLAKHSKYGPCSKPKDTKYDGKKYETFQPGPGRNRSMPRRNEVGTFALGLVRRGNSCADYLPRVGKVLSIPARNLIILAHKAHQHLFEGGQRGSEDRKEWNGLDGDPCRPEARNAMDPASADALTAAFLEFDADKKASVAVFYGAGGAFCAGWDLKYVSTLNAEYPLGELDIPSIGTHGNGGEIPRGPLGPSRLELDKPVIAAIEGPAVAGGMELGLWCDFRVMAKERLFRRLLSSLGRAIDRWRNGAPAAHRRPGPRTGNYSHRTEGAGGRMSGHWSLRIRDPQRRCTRKGGRTGAGDCPFPAGLRARRPSLGDQESRA